MRKSIVFLGVCSLLALASCDSSKTKAASKGIIDCYSVQVYSGGSTIYNGTYSNSTSKVYEYKDSNNNYIYLNTNITDMYYNNATLSLRVYNDRYSADYIEYSYVGFVGWLTYEQNYYLDLDNKVIDYETKWSKYIYELNPENPNSSEGTPDNEKAYNCARKGYYLLNYSYPANDNGKYYYTLKTDLVESGLERHQFTKLGDDDTITYKGKWF